MMLASQAGDAQAHRRLLERLSGHLRAYFKRRLMQDDQSAEDLVQETLLAIHTHRHTYNPERPFTPWVYAIGRYRLIDYLRATKTMGDQVPIEEASEIVSHDDRADAESAFDLDKLMARLPTKTRDAIRSVKLEGMSVKETASRTGMSESSVKVSIHRGLRALATLMSREAAR